MALYEEEPNGCWMVIDGILAIIFAVGAAAYMDEAIPKDASFIHAFMNWIGWAIVAFFAFLVGHVFTRIGFVWAWLSTLLVLWIW